jgi:hypothetical protein
LDGEQLSETFVELTDTMVAGFDVIDFLHVLTDRSCGQVHIPSQRPLTRRPRGVGTAPYSIEDTVGFTPPSKSPGLRGP